MHTTVKVNMKTKITGTFVPIKAAFKGAVRPISKSY
jgi:hypothetical protein